MFLQRTIRERTVVEGIGLHTGRPAKLIFCPAPDDTGIYFVRRDLPGQPYITPRAEQVKATSMATTIGCEEFSVSTVEHCLSALAAFRIDNLIIELEGPEIPIGDGSAKVFLDALLKVGFVEQNQPRTYAYIMETINETEADKQASVTPYDGLRVSCTIDFPHPTIGRQSLDIEITEQTFSREISGARTFGFYSEVEALRAKGLALGGSLDNAIVLDEKGVINSEGLRWPDEFVRHKVLDALGDLVTLGFPLMGHVVLHKAGHELMNRLVKRILETPGAYRRLELGATLSELDTVGSFGV
jgi:UDP-3-O-[3-hydroxymyristoyl] N-acetylglucosamine deacetylase